MESFYCSFCKFHFVESVFPPLGGDKPINNKWREITWNTPSLLHLDPRTKQSELEVQRILHLQDLADQLLDAFTDPNKVNLISCLLLYSTVLMKLLLKSLLRYSQLLLS